MSPGTPSSPAEIALLTVLREAFGDQTITAADDFYAIGGHSLIILPITRRLREEYGLELDLREFWRNAHIESLIAACRPAVAQETP